MGAWLSWDEGEEKKEEESRKEVGGVRELRGVGGTVSLCRRVRGEERGDGPRGSPAWELEGMANGEVLAAWPLGQMFGREWRKRGWGDVLWYLGGIPFLPQAPPGAVHQPRH